MKKTILIYVRGIVLVSVLMFLFAFANERNTKRVVATVKVDFIDEQDIYIDKKTVNKLLIQSQGNVTSVPKEALVLNLAEQILDTHLMIKDADVYRAVNGVINVIVKQRTPIARVHSGTAFYVDDTGVKMPLSVHYTARVPMVYNVSEKELKEVFPLLQKINTDGFLGQHVTKIHRNTEGDYELGIRAYDFIVNFGKVVQIERKINNFKAFYQKALKDQSLGNYKKVSLQFSNQVVCTKK